MNASAVYSNPCAALLKDLRSLYKPPADHGGALCDGPIASEGVAVITPISLSSWWNSAIASEKTEPAYVKLDLMVKLQCEIMKRMHVAYTASSLHQLQLVIDDANEMKNPKVSITRMDGD